MGARVSVTTEMNDMGLRRLVERTNALAGTGVRVGYQVDSGRVDGVDILDIAIWNNYGVPSKTKAGYRIPPRPFMENSAIKYSHDMGLLMAHAAKAVANGRVTKLSALQQLGEEYQKRIAAHIRSGEFERNADSTIKKKGSAVPLVDQGRHLIPGLRWVIDARAQTPRGGRGRI